MTDTIQPPPPDELVELAKSSVAAADAATAKARDLVSRRQRLSNEHLATANTSLATAKAKLAGLTTHGAENDRLTFEAAEAAARALKSSYEAVEAAGIGGGIGDKKEEWKECRLTIDRFDKLLVDLRKTGFGVVTALVGAATFLFTLSSPGTSVSILCILVLLIAVLQWIDRVHQVWLLEAVKRAVKLEEELGFRITTTLGEKFKGLDATMLGIWFYLILLIATCTIFWFAIPLKMEGPCGGHRMIIYGAGVVGVLFMIASLSRRTAVGMVS
jgi:hypothetical protein